MSEPIIPPKTVSKITENTPKGQRHTTAKEIAISLIGNGLPPAAVFQTLRQKFEEDVTDDELNKVVNYAVKLKPVPTVYKEGRKSGFSSYKPDTTAPKAKEKSPLEHATWWLSGKTMKEDEFRLLSQLKSPEKQGEVMILVLEMLYEGAENLNIVCDYQMNGEKANPKGPGRIITRDKWVEYVREKGVPYGRAGAWFRPNPCKAQGSGTAGSVTDSDVVSYPFLLLESDILPFEVQFALYSKFKLPIAAVLLSGGVSVHAWVRLDAENQDDYSVKSRRILAALAPFGIDQGNKNPSRLSRLPGATRMIQATGDGIQKLLWLNPGKVALTKKELEKFEDSLLMPALEEKPFSRLIDEAFSRYDEMILNKGKLGVPTGFSKFDSVSGGLKPGGYTLIGAATGVGKTTIALNMVNAALKAGIGVVLFTMEMTREDIVDMMFSLNCKVDRNLFNTGEFSDGDMKKMVGGSGWMKNLPLWVDDEPSITMASMRRKVLAMRADNLIGLAVVDYAQLALTDERPDNREQAVAAIALGMRLLSREANIPIILLSQLNDDGRVRESRKLAHEASNVFKMERKSGRLDDPNIILYIDKGRKIPATPLQLYLKAEYCLITEISGISNEDVQTSRTPYPE
jgi:KaiC/GvpD/RAD55 family RecA-like ATPase